MKAFFLIQAVFVIGLNDDDRQAFLKSGNEMGDFLFEELDDFRFDSEFDELSENQRSLFTNDMHNFAQFIHQKLIIIEDSNYQYKFTKNTNIFSSLNNLCQLPASSPNSEFQELINSIKSELEDSSLLLFPINPQDLKFPKNSSTLLSPPKPYPPFLLKESQEQSPVLQSILLNFLSILFDHSLILKSSSLPPATSSNYSLIEKFSNILKIRSSSLPLFDYLLNSALFQYSFEISSNFKELSQSFSCFREFPDYPKPESKAQQIADSLQEVRLSYIDQNGQVLINSEDLKLEIEKYNEIEKDLDYDEKILMNFAIVDFQQITKEKRVLYEILEIIQENLIFIYQGKVSLVLGKVTNSENLTADEYQKMMEVSLNFSENIPIVATGNSSNDIATPDGNLIQETGLRLNEDDFKFNDTQVEVFHRSFVVLTTFFGDKEGTGKVWVLPLRKPSGIYLLLEGFRAPVSACFDRDHMFLYVVDKKVGKKDGRIFQYKIRIKKGKLAIAHDFYVKVYSGDPGDCKVDFYGNLYFTDTKKNSINFISFADLFSGFQNKYFTIYSNSKENKKLTNPESLTFSSSGLLFFTTSEKEHNFINYAASEVESLNQYKVNYLLTRSKKISGIAYGDNKIFYSVEGAVFCFNLLKMSEEILNDYGFIDPQGLCYLDNKLFVADHAVGAVFVVDLVKKDVRMIASVQAVFGLVCLDFEEILVRLRWIIIAILI
jgi:sugar lactone lactonase YvrE